MKRLINQFPNPLNRALLGAVPFLLVVLVYVWGSDLRLAANPDDKLMPPFNRFVEALHTLAF